MDKMQEKTRSIATFKVDNRDLSVLIRKRKTNKLITSLNEWYSEVDRVIQKAKYDYTWLHFENCGIYFVPAEGILIADPEIIKLSPTELVPVEEFGKDMNVMTLQTVVNLFSTHKDNNPLLSVEGGIIYSDEGGRGWSRMFIYTQNSPQETVSIDDCSLHAWGIGDSDSVKLPVYYLKDEEKKDIIIFLLKRNFRLKNDDKKYRFIRELCSELIKEDRVDYQENGGFSVKQEWLDWCLEKFEEFTNDFSNLSIKKEFESDGIDGSSFNLICEKLLCCDERRIHMERYSQHRLKDPESGHWDLWNYKEDGVSLKLPEKLVARNPVWDALSNRSGIVGIDFGTKSTVVTYRKSRADIMPMRIGSGQYSRTVSETDYENPTVMEFRDIENFCQAYRAKEGRPETQWEDLLVSHEAFAQLKSDQSRGDTFATFFSELKQWSSDKERQVTLKDNHGREIDLKPYMELGDDDFDPIEIYAYYIGMFINNMDHGIFLRYKLSFPAKAEKAVREKILSSFERGIKKSLPQQVLDDEECKKYLKIEQGVSEPAAYAVCALKEYGFDQIEEDEKVYYGIFDFGGGTTDFDFGVWSLEDEEKYEDNYDYKISRFGKGEDPYLGGENLLADLAYDVFNDNYQELLKKNIIFTRPYGAREEVGKDWLVKPDSQYARFNSKRLMEKLRGVWENDPGVRESMESGSIQVSLFDQDGENNPNFLLNVNLEELDKSIEEHVERGVTQFFSTLKNSFGNNLSDISEMGEINIFLAGNSSKSPVVAKVFKKYIDQLYADMMKANGSVTEWIKVYPPLGTSQAVKIQRGELKPIIDEIIENQGKQKDNKKGENISVDSTGTSGQTKQGEKEDQVIIAEETENLADLLGMIKKPNGKTGVAFGLLDSKVRIEQNEKEESGFSYYIGQNKRNKFRCIIDKDQQRYNEWIRFCAATVSEFEIWFTRSSEAASNNLPIDERGIYLEMGYIDEVDEEKSVYIRLVSPTEIEYTIVGEEEIRENTIDRSEIVSVLLQEKA